MSNEPVNDRRTVLVKEDADKDDAAGNGVTQGGGIAKEIDHVSQHNKDRCANKDAKDGTLAAPQAAASKNGSSNGVELKKRPVCAGLD